MGRGDFEWDYDQECMEELLVAGLRLLAWKIEKMLDLDGDCSTTYGANFENDVFMMHRYCWCDRDDCPWCGGCTCPDEAYHYFVDGKEVSREEWDRFFKENVGEPSEYKSFAAWERKADRINKRREVRHDPVCDYCLGRGVSSQHGAEPGRGAPNFWYKPNDIKVYWYKWIGRDMTINKKITDWDALLILIHCLDSIRDQLVKN